ncbi:envelope stress response membrane protein PspB [Raoultella planticola]|uniref:Envelope stress response membrane protein PspB n=1 Tax=Raoultella planticola TaxID=575 RepID=A0A5P6AB08_RAOPL|nr:envelope stress response membrane protein PspB [Raoultella planticola]
MRRRSLTVRSTHEYAFIAIPLTLFVLFVLPVWLWLHYNNRTASGSLSQNEQQRLLQLTDDAKRMRERIQTLEDILDAEHPNWRDK